MTKNLAVLSTIPTSMLVVWPRCVCDKEIQDGRVRKGIVSGNGSTPSEGNGGNLIDSSGRQMCRSRAGARFNSLPDAVKISAMKIISDSEHSERPHKYIAALSICQFYLSSLHRQI